MKLGLSPVTLNSAYFRYLRVLASFTELGLNKSSLGSSSQSIIHRNIVLGLPGFMLEMLQPRLQKSTHHKLHIALMSDLRESVLSTIISYCTCLSVDNKISLQACVFSLSTDQTYIFISTESQTSFGGSQIL